MAKGLASRGFEPIVTETREAAMDAIIAGAPAFAVIEARLAQGSGLEVLERLREERSDCRVVVLTAYGSIPLAVAAVKAGAIDVLLKPADPEYVTQVLMAAEDEEYLPPPEEMLSPARVRWEHIMRVYETCGHNVSQTARRLRMHRRTLQRILGKRAPQ
jgi:two-component system response regulator RegA